MKIRCGSHQQNRSIVRPGLSLMAAKVALTAEEFRENSQRSIALFNTEKLSTNSTHVLKSAYCNSVHFCRCNLHGACGGKGLSLPCTRGSSSCNLHGACGGKAVRDIVLSHVLRVAICTERVEAKVYGQKFRNIVGWLQSARSVWRQSSGSTKEQVYGYVAICTERVEAKGCTMILWECSKRCNLHGACGGKALCASSGVHHVIVAICTERVEAKIV